MPVIVQQDPNIRRDRLAGRLPLRARRKLDVWGEAEREALSLVQSDAERLIELQGEKAQAARELTELEKADRDGKLFIEKRMPDETMPSGFVMVRERDTNRLDSARAAVDRAQDQIDRLRERQSQRGRTPLHSVEEYFRSIGNVALTEDVGPPAKLSKGESWPDAIEKARTSIRDLQNEAAATKLAAIPSAEAKKRTRAEIERLAAAGRLGTLALLERAGTIRWPVFPLEGVELKTGAIPQIPDTYAVLAWLFKDQLIKALDRELDEFGDDEGALTDEQRTARLAKIAEQILAADRNEEGLIEAAEAEGISISRRSDCDPRALLGLSSQLPAPRHS